MYRKRNRTKGTSGGGAGGGVWHGRCFLLTYPKCALTRDEVLAKLKSLPEENAIVDGAVVAQERHLDGTAHLHACVIYANPIRASCRTFDIQGFHPNIRKAMVTPDRSMAESVYRMWLYCEKFDKDRLYYYHSRFAHGSIMAVWPSIVHVITRDAFP